MLSLVLICLLAINKTALGLSVPDYESMWIPMRSGDSEQARVTVKHGLGETPLLVDVQVKAMHEPNKDFIFTGIGGRPRDDDESEPFGGVIYYYNNEKIVASAPIKNSKLGRDGFAIYTENGTYFSGRNSQEEDHVHVRFRAWRAGSLPTPDMNKTAVPVRARSADPSELYVTTAHGLDAYPALVLVRAKLIDGQMPGYMADSVGASFVSYPDDNPDNEYFIHAFNDRNIRVWVSDTGLLAGGSDGYEIFPHCSSGMLEMYAWAASSLQPAITAAMDLGPEVVDEQLEIPLTSGHVDSFTRAWVEAVDGPNVGYRFPGSGAMAYSATVLDPVCTYGGLTYAYTQEAVRFWRPTDVINGGLVCVASVFGNGRNAQRSVNGLAIVMVWTSVTHPEDTFQWADPEERCIRIQP
ncbi:uncharacterized protein LOC128210316 [Mya arenaria]|uniref:uncharacterized protein LOC128210316 n=1 Tax=Mya arenaria TaxID=6604 RepID=UPI0022E62E75|nr:uncharacterized protein LOC128210316 [Mya arenaria]